MIYRRDVSSGMVHEADDAGRTHEADNLDEAGAYEVITEAEAEATPLAKKCRRCFPQPDDAGDVDEAPVE